MVKYRLQNGGDFGGSFNVGAAIAYTFRHDSLSPWSVSAVGGFGLSSITLDKTAVNTDTAGVSSVNGISALTFSFGGMLQYNKIQFGVFLGWDKISKLNNTTYGWKYQGNTWLSIGLGYSIFSPTSSSSSTSGGDTQ